jgi:hypothetical protein
MTAQNPPEPREDRMNRQATLIAALLLFIPPAVQIQAKSRDNIAGPTIAVTKLDVTKKDVKLSWEIKNDSRRDIWVLAGLDRSEITTSVFMAEDNQTLLVRRRLDLPARPERASFPTCDGRYIRLRPGGTQAESVSLAVPVHCEPGIGVGGRKFRGLEHASRLRIEIGYYAGNMPAMVRRSLEEDQKNPHIVPCVDPSYPNTITGWFGGLRGFNRLNELLRWRDDELLIPYTSQAFTGEQVLRATAGHQDIPYEEKIDWSTKRCPPDLSACTRVEICYQPSALAYFFPYPGEQALLTPAEREYLGSTRSVVVKNANNLTRLAKEISEGESYSDIVRQRGTAHFVCYRSHERLLSFPMYNDNSIVTGERYRFEYAKGLQMLKLLTPQVEPIELRVQCAGNLKHLWNRFRLYDEVAKPGFFSGRIRPYPPPSTWCTSLLRAYHTDHTAETSDEYLMRPYKCPSAGYGKCHYAMNPDCSRGSPADTVLLFETKAGWNQHGGPELFTFDNHNPKGGCVLLNGGAVKFIRTKEELRQLRWK